VAANVQAQASIPEATREELRTLIERREFDRLEGQLSRLKSKFPDDFLINKLLGDSHLRRNEFAEARKRYEIALTRGQKNVRLRCRTARACRDMGDLPAAETQYRAAVDLEPNDREALAGLVGVLFDQKKNGEAGPAARMALSRGVTDSETLYNGALAFMRSNRKPEAQRLLAELVKIDPNHAGAFVDLGNMATKQGDKKAAERFYREALRADPDRAGAMNNLGTILVDFGKLREAKTLIERSIELSPNDYKMHVNHGRFLHKTQQLQKARAAYEKAIEINPSSFAAHSNLAGVFKDLSLFPLSYATYEKAIELAPAAFFVRSNYIFTACHDPTISNQETLEMSLDFAKAVRAAAKPYTHAPPESPRKGPLKVGFVSGDFREHAVAFFLEAFLSKIDQSRVELHAYASQTSHDAFTERLSKIFTGWRKVSPLSDAQLAKRIHDDGIDVLFDLSGHTGGNRLPMFAFKPAPVQATWLGLEATTGMSEIDYIMTDAWSMPESEESLFAETPWRMPDVRQCFTPPDIDVPVAPLPVLEAGHVTFGSFNKYTKVNEQTVRIWSGVLKAVPDSRLLLKAKSLADPPSRKKLYDAFAENGIEAERLDFRGPTPSRAKHLATYGEIDIALDPAPYPGITTTLEALWMGAPVLALRGSRFLERASDSILSAAGLADWVAEDEDAYVRIARERAEDIQSLARLRGEIRDKVAASPLCDADAFARKFEDAVESMYARFVGESGGAAAR